MARSVPAPPVLSQPTRSCLLSVVVGKIFEYVHGLAASLAMDIRECRRELLVSRAAQRLSGRSAEP